MTRGTGCATVDLGRRILHARASVNEATVRNDLSTLRTAATDLLQAQTSAHTLFNSKPRIRTRDRV